MSEIGEPTGHDPAPLRTDECRCPACVAIDKPRLPTTGVLNPNTGHGHVRPRPDGVKARCGGPAMCKECARDAGQFQRVHPLQAINDAPSIVPGSGEGGARTIIALTGLAGSGKSTVAQRLVERHGFVRVRFAGPLKDMMAALGLTQNQIEGTEKESPCARLGGCTPRRAMQTIGTEWGRDLINRDLWIHLWRDTVAKLPAWQSVVVDDCRFPNEADTVRAAGGVLVAIVRPGAGAGAAGHSSEGQPLGDPIATIDNASTVEHLRQAVDKLVRDLSWAAAAAR